MLDFLKLSVASRTGTERTIWILLLCFVFSITFSIAITHILLGSIVILYLYRKIRYDRVFPRFGLLLPAAAFSYLTLLSVVFSIHPSLSLIHAKNLTLFIILPVFFDSVRDLDDVRVIYGTLIFAGIISAAYGLFQFFGSDTGLSSIRIKGFLSHWMTFSGLLMMLNVLLLSHLLFSPKLPLWFYLAFGILSLGLLLSLTRNAWIGFLAAACVLLPMRRVRFIFLVPVGVFIVFVVSPLVFPSFVAERLTSVFNPNETSNRDRIQMLHSGWKIIQDYPLTGVGGDMIEVVYPQYREPDSPFRNNPHLHNNFVQLAAENGVLALFAWLWLLIKVVVDLVHWKRNVKSPEEKLMIHGTIGIVVSVVVAGLFEYNFGDSEIRMLFLTLITLPYAWNKRMAVSDIPQKVSPAEAAVEATA